MAVPVAPTLTLNNGVKIPAFGLGTMKVFYKQKNLKFYLNHN